MLKLIFVALLVMVLIPTAQAAVSLSEVTFYSFDEQTLLHSPYTITITNGTHSFFDGRFSRYVSNTPGASFTITNPEYACDYDISTSAKIQCTAGANCNAVDFEIVCDVGMVYYVNSVPASNSDPRFNMSIRGYSSNPYTLEFEIFDNSGGGSYTSIGTPAITTSPSQTYMAGSGNNQGGRYGSSGTARIRISKTGNMGLNDFFMIDDVWTVKPNQFNDSIILGTSGNGTTVSSWSRQTTDDSYNGGIPKGSLEIVLKAEYTDSSQTALDRAERKFYTTIVPGVNQTINTYLLRTSQGTNVVFSVFAASPNNPLSGVLITGQRNLNGSYIAVAQAKTQGGGIGTVFLKNNADNLMTFSLSGYAALSQIISTTISSYQIFMRTTAAAGFTGILNDIAYLFSPVFGTIQASNIGGSINFTVLAPNSNLDYFGFTTTLIRTNGSQTMLRNDTINVSPSGGFIVSNFSMNNFSAWDRLLVRFNIKKMGESSYIETRTYAIIRSASNYTGPSFLQTISAIKTQGLLDDFSAGMVALFAALLVAGFAMTKGVPGFGLGLIMLTVLGFFVVVGFFNPIFYTLMILVVVGFFILRSSGGL